MKVEERTLARTLRRDDGLSMRVIAERLGVSKSSVSRWVRDIELTAEQHAVLRRLNPRYDGQLRGQVGRSASARAARVTAQAHGRELARLGDPLHLQGCLLYWAEGSKHRNRATFTNSDPEIVKLFVRFLRQCYGVGNERMALTVNCYVTNGLSAGEIVDWWLRELRLPDARARAPVVNRISSASQNRRGHVLPYGTVRIVVCSVFVLQSIYGAIQQYGGFDRPEWLDDHPRENERVLEPRSSRPYMPGYGVQGSAEGSGLLPWAWAVERLERSQNYWVTTLWPDGRPHSMPVWGVWDGEVLWFSSSGRSRKARNVAGDPRCVVATEDANEPVVLDGRAEIVVDMDAIARVVELMNAKYRSGMTVDFLDPAVNATVRVAPRWAFGIAHDDFTGSPTRWVFDEA